MPNVEHSSLTGSEAHEPKGATTANAGEVYVADGAASGDWKAGSAYGNLYTITGDAVTISTIGTTAKKFAGFAHDGVSFGTTISATNDQITVAADGIYQIHFNISFKTVAAADSGLYTFRLRINGVASTFSFFRQLSGTSDTGVGSFQGILSLSANDIVTVYISSDEAANTDDINVESCSLSVTLLRAT